MTTEIVVTVSSIILARAVQGGGRRKAEGLEEGEWRSDNGSLFQKPWRWSLFCLFGAFARACFLFPLV